MNFYALEINGEEKGDVRLNKVHNGEGETIAKADGFEIQPRTWTTFRISISPENTIAVYSSAGEKRNKDKILETVDELDPFPRG